MTDAVRLEQIETLLVSWAAGDTDARDTLLRLVYDDLKRLASRHLAREADGHTLDTTALVHEACADLLQQNAATWQQRPQFFAFMSTVMRHVLVDHARRRRSDKRGGTQQRVALRDDLMGTTSDVHDILDLDLAFSRLAAHAPRLAQVAECRLFGGMNDGEIALALGVSERTAAREWTRARAWLQVALSEHTPSVADVSTNGT